ncbi:hypothetical protein BDQ17DRAFT_1426495 [Cyathus striatus]|nr:hypothetical protein BDQ17DRAFT_1426495 [Cyathus striatus]
MKFASIVALLGLAAAPAFAQSPTCYTSGTAGASSCQKFIPTFCSDVSQSSFQPGDNGGRCFTSPNGGYRCDFTAYNSISSYGAPDQTNCQDVLNSIANQCSQGGEGKVSDSARFTFSLDPNSGSCGTTVQPGS